MQKIIKIGSKFVKVIQD